MNSLDKHISLVKASEHDDDAKSKLINMMSIVWKHLADNGQPSTISSSVGGKHKTASKHYACMAFDINPDKGYSIDFVREVKRAVNKSGYKVRVLVEFNNCKPGDGRYYRCTHIEFNTVKEGLYVLDYVKNTSTKMVI